MTVAQTALWIAELKMKRETEEIVHKAHCVVVGMADKNLNVDKKIFDGDKIFHATNINPYLVDAPTVFIESRAKPLYKQRA